MLDPRFKQMDILIDYYKLLGHPVEPVEGNPISLRRMLDYYSSKLVSFSLDAYLAQNPEARSSVSVEQTGMYTSESLHLSPEGIVKTELANFRMTEVAPRASNPLEWWKKNQIKFPYLAQVARAIFSIPASQVEVERMFSVTGTLTARRRAGMEAETLNDLVFLNKNMPDDPRTAFPDNCDLFPVPPLSPQPLNSPDFFLEQERVALDNFADEANDLAAFLGDV